MLQFSKNSTTEFECYIQGPILIQHSKRRYLESISEQSPNDAANIIHRIAQDEDYPGRRFDFYDNPHGHFMYAYFDRCLLRHIPELVELDLNGWIIDARGESDEYLSLALAVYQEEYTRYKENLSDYVLDREQLNKLSKVARKAQKPGFFKANQTDKQRYNTHLPNEYEFKKIGRVLDIIKGSRLTIEIEEPIDQSQVLYAFHPKCDGLALSCEKIWSLKK